MADRETFSPRQRRCFVPRSGRGIAEPEEADIAQVVAGDPLQNLERCGTGDLKQVVIEAEDPHVIGNVDRRDPSRGSTGERFELDDRGRGRRRTGAGGVRRTMLPRLSPWFRTLWVGRPGPAGESQRMNRGGRFSMSAATPSV